LFRVGPYDRTWVENTVSKDEMSEDLSWCWAARKIGFKVYWDLDQFLGHITETKLIPARDKDGQYRVMSNIDGHCSWLQSRGAKDGNG
jgi:hypothetical protein